MNTKENNWPLGMPENFINCPICLKKLKTPKCLPCLHTICLSCLNMHIVSSERTDNSFFCPVCGEECKSPMSSKSPDEWAKYFKSNQLIDSVLDAIEIKKGDRKCDPCQATKKRAAAVTWCTSCREALCSSCTTSHQGMRLTRAHALIEINKIKSQPVAAVIKDEKCQEHDDQVLVFYCKEHKEQCCPTCAITLHRKCDNVVKMAKLGKEIRSSKMYEKLLKRLNACLGTQRGLIDKRNAAKQSMTTKKTDILFEINDLKVKLFDLLESMESIFVKEFDSLHTVQERELQSGMEQGQRIARSMSNTIAILEAAISFGSDTHLFMMMEKLQEECRKYEKMMVANKTELAEISYTFKMDERLKLVANSVKKFGHLSIDNDCTTKQSFKDSHVRETAIFGARTPFDDLRGVDVFSNGYIIIADRMNKSVLLFNENGDFVAHVNFNTRPWGVAVLGVRKACVSLPESQAIHIINFSNRNLEEHSVISTNISCFAISNFCGEYLTIQHQDCKIAKGQNKDTKEQKRRVAIGKSEKQANHKASIDITANHDNIQGITYDEATGKIFIVADSNSLECYSDRGRFLFRNSYPGYGDFHGMSVDRESNVYIASFAGKGVLQISSDGERIRMISTSPLAPLDVAITPQGNKMVAVGRSEMVHVFTFR